MTYRETFEKYLPKGVVELAIDNTFEPNSEVFINETNEDWSELKQALYTGFWFENTSQGSDYWFNILDTYE